MSESQENAFLMPLELSEEIMSESDIQASPSKSLIVRSEIAKKEQSEGKRKNTNAIHAEYYTAIKNLKISKKDSSRKSTCQPLSSSDDDDEKAPSLKRQNAINHDKK